MSSVSSSSSATSVVICPRSEFAYPADDSGFSVYMPQIMDHQGYHLKFNQFNDTTVACVDYLIEEYGAPSKNANTSVKYPNLGTGTGEDRLNGIGAVYGVMMNLFSQRATIARGTNIRSGTCYFESALLPRVQRVLEARGFAIPRLPTLTALIPTMPTPLLSLIDGYLDPQEIRDYTLNPV